jgi:hypothetical protein
VKILLLFGLGSNRVPLWHNIGANGAKLLTSSVSGICSRSHQPTISGGTRRRSQSNRQARRTMIRALTSPSVEISESRPWWSWLLEHFGATMLYDGVADGLARLKSNEMKPCHQVTIIGPAESARPLI